MLVARGGGGKCPHLRTPMSVYTMSGAWKDHQRESDNNNHTIQFINVFLCTVKVYNGMSTIHSDTSGSHITLKNFFLSKSNNFRDGIVNVET